MTNPAAVDAAIARYRPWAIVNAAGYVKVDQAETEVARCMADNAAAPAVLAQACARHGVALLTFSSDLVFDGNQRRPYLESDTASPLNVYGRSKVNAEQRVLAALPSALVVRTSAFFGPWDPHNFVSTTLHALQAGKPVFAHDDITVSPTYVPDLVATCLDLLIDGERGIWHLSNHTAVTWAELARQAAEEAGLDTSLIEPIVGADPDQVAARPAYSVLGTERGILMPSLDDALARYAALRERSGLSAPLRSGTEEAVYHAPHS
jgi:dTDP-4-dehydrorhamnose reductase